MRIRWLRTALRNVEQAHGFIAKDSPGAAHAVVGRIGAAVQQLVDFPFSGRPGRVKGTRELVVIRTPFIVAYRVRGEIVDVLRVIHGAMRWPRRI